MLRRPPDLEKLYLADTLVCYKECCNGYKQPDEEVCRAGLEGPKLGSVSVPKELGASMPLPPGKWTCSPAQKLSKPIP